MANSSAIVQEFVVRTFLAAKLHGGSVTEVNLEYEGSITIDPQLMNEVGILPYEQVDVFDVTNGARFTTYAIEGSSGSREICVNGAAAHLVAEGDCIIVVAYVSLSVEDTKVHKPKIVYLDAENRITHRTSNEDPKYPEKDAPDYAVYNDNYAFTEEQLAELSEEEAEYVRAGFPLVFTEPTLEPKLTN